MNCDDKVIYIMIYFLKTKGLKRTLPNSLCCTFALN